MNMIRVRTFRFVIPNWISVRYILIDSFTFFFNRVINYITFRAFRDITRTQLQLLVSAVKISQLNLNKVLCTVYHPRIVTKLEFRVIVYFIDSLDTKTNVVLREKYECTIFFPYYTKQAINEPFNGIDDYLFTCYLLLYMSYLFGI